MGLKGKLTGETEVSSHGHHVHHFFSKKPHAVSDISPTHFQGCELLEGEFGKSGSVIYWNYTLDGKACTTRQVVDIDEDNKTMSFKVLDGDLLEGFSSMVVHLHATEKEVKWIFEYEKLSEDTPHPTKELDFIMNVNKHIDDHHTKAA